MKCPSCGADIGNSKTCEFCGTPVSYDMKREQEQLNKQGCPKCGSTNITFNREKQGEYRGKSGTSVVRATVGVCKDCGYTWNASGKAESKKDNSMLWWVLGWIFFFPAPVMVLIWRKKCTWDIKVKIAVTVVFWILIFILGSGGDKNADSTKQSTETKIEEASETSEDKVSKYSKPETSDSSDTSTKIEEAVENAVESTTKQVGGHEIDTSVSKEYQNALRSAYSYSDMMHMSKKRIYDQLTSEYGEQFTSDEAQYAVDNLEVDYKKNALETAKSYYNEMGMSKASVYDQLISEYGEQFTADEAQYAIDNLDK